MFVIKEDLRPNDLKMLVDHIFEIDSYASKMGSDKDITVISFTVKTEEAAKDLVDFIEKGYEFVLDADATPGEADNGKYKVFVEIERNRRIGKQILEILDGVGKLADLKNFKFRYYKSFLSQPANEQTLSEIPTTKTDYENKIEESRLNNFSNFFERSYLENINVDNDEIIFQKMYAEPLRMKIKEFGNKDYIYENIKGNLMIESKDIAEILFLTKYLGNYNISKVSNLLIFENVDCALVLEKL